MFGGNSNLEDRPRIAVTMGDPAGVGPEIIIKTFEDPLIYDFSCPIIVGDAKSLSNTALRLKSDLSICKVSSPKEASFSPGSIDVLNLKNIPDNITMGQPSSLGGKASVEFIRMAVDLALGHHVDAITTAPVNKESIHLAGFNWPGQTEMLGEFTGAKDVALMLAGDVLRVVIATTHVPLHAVKKLVTREQVTTIIQLTHHWLLENITDSPNIAVTGLNPHCGDGGIFGKEELTVIIPALNNLRKEG
ncbi:uncharacterized protein METZ01_LOCUS377869, partial [marine metagenome]